MAICTKCNLDKTDFYPGRAQCKTCHKKISYAGQKRKRLLDRAAAVAALGSECWHCGFSDIRALQIDHVHGGGVREYRTIGSQAVNQRVLTHPEDYQLLCANCNWIKRFENGEHKPNVVL